MMLLILLAEIAGDDLTLERIVATSDENAKKKRKRNGEESFMKNLHLGDNLPS